MSALEYASLSDAPLGVLVAFVDNDSPLSDVMKTTYEDFYKWLEGQVPLTFVDVAHDLARPSLPDALVYSAPTLLWVVNPELAKSCLPFAHPVEDFTGSIVARWVGTVLLKKLQADAEPLIEKLIA